MKYDFEQPSTLSRAYNFLSKEWDNHIHPVLHWIAVPSVLAYGLYQNNASVNPIELVKLILFS